jgi:cephalosporin hydroxylase
MATTDQPSQLRSLMTAETPQTPPSALSGHRAYEEDIGALEIYKSYMRSPYLSRKHSSYFQVYTDLFEPYRHKELTFVEVGVMNGGSLFMWRDYFGPKARIIGIDLNPGARRWERDGFEIFIGSQSDPTFWQSVLQATGPVDIVLDDGGHTFEQQIVTVDSCIPHIREGGLIVVEDTHTSYYEEFGYPTKYSFIEWTKRLIDNINSRAPRVNVSLLPYKRSIYSISIFQSIVCFSIRPSRCHDSQPTSNEGASVGAVDFRYDGSSVGTVQGLFRDIADRFPVLRRIRPIKLIWTVVRSRHSAFITRRNLRRLGNFF